MIRLQRVGRKNDPSFRVVVIDSHRAAKCGSAIEILGQVDARRDVATLQAERIHYWLGVGAKTSATVNNLLVKNKIISGQIIAVDSKKNLKKSVDETVVAPVSTSPETKASLEIEPAVSTEPVASTETDSATLAEAETSVSATPES